MSDLQKLVEAESSYTEFYDVLKSCDSKSYTGLIHTAHILKILGRRPIVLMQILQFIKDREGAQLSEIYEHVGENFGNDIRKKLEAGAGLPQHLNPLVDAGLLKTRVIKMKKRDKTVWLPTEREYILHVDKGLVSISEPSDEITSFISNQLDRFRLPLKVVHDPEQKHPEQKRSEEAFDPIELLESLVKSDINFLTALSILNDVSKRLKESRKYKSRINITDLIQIIDEEIGEEFADIDVEQRIKFERMLVTDQIYSGSYILGTTEEGGIDWIPLTPQNLEIIVAKVTIKLFTPELLLQKMKVWKDLEEEYTKLESEGDKKDSVSAFLKHLADDKIIKLAQKLIHKGELDKITRNIHKIVKRTTIKYSEPDFLKLLIKSYLEDRRIVFLEPPKEMVEKDYKDYGRYLESSINYLIKRDLKNSIYYAVRALAGYYTILFTHFNKVLGSGALSSLTRFDKELFEDKKIREKLKALGVLEIYSSTSRYLKGETNILLHALKGESIDKEKILENIKTEQVIKLVDMTRQVGDATKIFISNNELKKI